MKNVEELKKIESKNDMPEGATYYSDEYMRRGNRHMHWTCIYDENFNILEEVTVKYTNSLDGMKRIVRSEEKDDIALAAYDLKKLNNRFYLVEENEHTGEALRLICESVKQK